MMGQVVRPIRRFARDLDNDFRRATPIPILIRAAIFLAGTGALFVAYPPVWWLPALAIFPALLPRTMAATGLILITVGLWLASTSMDASRLVTWRLCVLAILLYLVHVGCALSAVLPYDSVITSGVFRPWLLRIGVVSVLTVVVGLFVRDLPKVISTAHSGVDATIAGIVLMVTTAIFIAYLGYRRQ
jgi:hypothetical protein